MGLVLKQTFAEMKEFPNRFLGLDGEVFWEALPELPKDLSVPPKGYKIHRTKPVYREDSAGLRARTRSLT